MVMWLWFESDDDDGNGNGNGNDGAGAYGHIGAFQPANLDQQTAWLALLEQFSTFFARYGALESR